MARGLRSGRRWATTALSVVALTLSLSGTALGQGRTDVVTLANGDRITGEVVRLERGRLEFKTDDAGTLYLEWDKLVSLVAANRFVEVLTTTGIRYLGPLVPATERAISVATSEGAVTLQMSEVTLITPIGTSFWRKLDGSIDAGFSSTQSSGVTQLTFNSETVYRKPAFSARLTGSLTLTQTDDEEGRDDRGYVEASYLRYPWHRWFITSATRFETNESLGLELRSQICGCGRAAPGQQQPCADGDRRRTVRQRRTRRGCRGDAEHRGGRPLSLVLLHVRSAQNQSRRGLSVPIPA